MSILEKYVVFDDSQTPPKTKRKTKPKKSNKKDISIKENNTPINSVFELTVDALNNYFKRAKKVPKKDFNQLYKGRKTLLGSLLKENDIFIEVAVINTEGIDINTFLSISFRYVSKREIKDVSKKYVIIDPDRRYPLLVESKYMDMIEYVNYRDKIYKQFL